MGSRSLFFVLPAALLVVVAHGQENAPEPPQSTGVNQRQELVPNPPVNNELETFGRRSKGLDAPESQAIVMLYDQDHIRDLLTPTDYFYLSSARVNSERSVKNHAAFADVCRLAISLDERGFSSIDAANFGRRLNEAEDVTNEIIVNSYHAMLANLSENGAALVEERKLEIHKHMGAIEFDWEQQAQADQKLIGNYARNCAI